VTSGPAHAGERPEALVDLHTHSTASDGALPPAAVVAAAREAGLAAVAVTDHDTVAGVAAAAAAGSSLGVRVVPGVELSAMDGAREVHVLGLHVSGDDDLEQQLAAFRTARLTRAVRIVERLNQLGVPVTVASVLANAAGGAVGRPHIARAIVDGGWVRDTRDAFDRYLGAGRPAFVPKLRLSVGDAIQLVHRAGGLAIMAHPGADGTRARVEAFVALGLDGLEVRHPGHSAEDVARLAALVEHFGLVPSGGSDWHGTGEGLRMLGGQHVPLEWLARQEARLRTRAAEGLVA
jgi:predicted metal-dependent phosphoesterase TrpH